MKRYRWPAKPEIINIVVAVVGFVMILCASIFTVSQESIWAKLLNIMRDMGIGIFPTGVIGLALERMQSRNKEQEKKDKRIAMLRAFNNAIHSYLNAICNIAIAKNNSLKYKKIFDITKLVSSEEVHIEYSNNEIVALTLLVKRLQESFGLTNPLYIVSDIFETIEINHFEMLLKDGEKLLYLMSEDNDVNDKRNSFLSYLQVTCLAISECSSFNEMISDGDNIYIPSMRSQD